MLHCNRGLKFPHQNNGITLQSTEMFAEEFQKQSNNFALNTHFYLFIEAMSIATALCEPPFVNRPTEHSEQCFTKHFEKKISYVMMDYIKLYDAFKIDCYPSYPKDNYVFIERSCLSSIEPTFSSLFSHNVKKPVEYVYGYVEICFV